MSRLGRASALLLVVALIGALLALNASTSNSIANAAETTTFEAEGEILLGSPAGEISGVTEQELFLRGCAVPLTQGLDAYVFVLPDGFAVPGATVQVTGEADIYDLDVFFRGANCSSGRLTPSLATTSPDESGAIPVGTKYIIAANWMGGLVLVDLKATRPAGTVTPTPTGTVTPTPTGTVTPTPTPTPEPPAASITASAPDSARFGQVTPVGGRVATTNCQIGVVDVFKSPGGAPYRPVAQVPVKDGKWSFREKASSTSKYLAATRGGDCPFVRSAEERVKVFAKIVVGDVSAGCSGKVTGRVLPAKRGTRAELQAKRKGSWRTVSIDLLDKRSAFVLQAAGCGGHRVVWAKQDPDLEGATKTISIRR